jgi:hypothetical protein
VAFVSQRPSLPWHARELLCPKHGHLIPEDGLAIEALTRRVTADNQGRYEKYVALGGCIAADCELTNIALAVNEAQATVGHLVAPRAAAVSGIRRGGDAEGLVQISTLTSAQAS